MKKKSFLLLIATCITLLFSLGVKAQEAISKMKKTYPVAMQEYGKQMEELKTDYIIAIDVSNTMEKHKEEVIPALTRFFDTIGDGNYVRIVSFGTQAKEEQTKLEISKQTRPQIVAKLNYIYENVMKDAGMFGHTDFVLLGRKVIDLVEKDNDSDIHFLVIFSDIMDDPGTKAPGSNHREVKDWNDLSQKFANLDVPVNTLSTYFSHETKDEKRIIESIDLVSKAFPNFDYSSDINEVLGKKLNDSKFVIYTNKLKQLITKDIVEAGKKDLFKSKINKDKSLSLIFDFDDDDLNIKKYIRGIVVDTCFLTDKSADIAEVEFDNHKEISKRSGSSGIGSVTFGKDGLWTEDGMAEYTMRYHFIYQKGKDEKSQSFTNDMNSLGLLDSFPQEANLHADGKLVFIWPFWLVALLSLLSLVFLFLLIKNTIIPARIKNRKILCKEDLNSREFEFNADGKKHFLVGKPDACKVNDWSIPDSTFLLHIKAINGGPLNWIFKRKIRLSLDKNDKDTNLQQTIKGKSYKAKRANLLKGNVLVMSQGVTYEFSLLKNK